MDGRAALTLAANGGREWATHDRPDGDTDFFGVTFDFGIDFTTNLGAFLFWLWEHNGYHGDRTWPDDGSDSRRLLLPAATISTSSGPD